MKYKNLPASFGKTETLKVKDAFDLLQLVADAKRLWIEWRDDNRELEIDDRRVQDFRSRVEGMARRNGSREAKLDWYQLLSQWEIQLRQIEDSRALLTRLTQELDDKRKRTTKRGSQRQQRETFSLFDQFQIVGISVGIHYTH